MTTIDTQISPSYRNDRPRNAAKRAFDSVSALIDTLLDWQERARQRRELLSFGDRALQDFGANRTAAAAEGDKPFWRA